MTCLSYGILDFSTNNLTVIETDSTYVVTVRRTYSTKGTVSVDYELSTSQPYHTRMEGIRGSLVFNDGVEELTISGKVFKRQYYEENESVTIFTL